MFFLSKSFRRFCIIIIRSFSYDSLSFFFTPFLVHCYTSLICFQLVCFFCLCNGNKDNYANIFTKPRKMNRTKIERKPLSLSFLPLGRVIFFLFKLPLLLLLLSPSSSRCQRPGQAINLFFFSAEIDIILAIYFSSFFFKNKNKRRSELFELINTNNAEIAHSFVSATSGARQKFHNIKLVYLA